MLYFFFTRGYIYTFHTHFILYPAAWPPLCRSPLDHAPLLYECFSSLFQSILCLGLSPSVQS